MTAEQMSWEDAVLWLRSQQDQTEFVRACFYDDPLREAAERYYASSEWTALRKLLPPSAGRALDLGAGRGIAAYALARDGWKTTAVEPDPSAIVGANAIRQLVADTDVAITVMECSGESLPFVDGSFDLVHCRAVLHHARDLSQFCREAARVLAPGGSFVATREHVISCQEDLSIFLAGHVMHKLYRGEHAYMLHEYRQAICASGLQIQRELNPYQSDVNLHPDTMLDMKRRLAEKLHLPTARIIPDSVLGWLGARSSLPGRHYTFVASKSVNG